jgi:hypothetical protein
LIANRIRLQINKKELIFFTSFDVQ